MDIQKKIKSSIYVVLTVFFVITSVSLSAQYSLVGDATQVNTTTFQLTKDSLWQNGSVWNNTKYDLNKSFEVYFELYFGDADKGADGITFTLQQQGTNAGSAGQGIGAGGVKPSVIIEYDTFDNTAYDPIHDHITIEKNGDVNHNTANNLAGPIYATPDSLNIEDGKWHNSRVKWDAPSKTFQVYFDCILRLTYTGDIINNVFGGNPNVYYGFTAATGGSHNDQLVRGFSFVSPSQKFDVAICKGDTFKLDFSDKDIRTWKPAAKINATSPSHPLFFPTVFTQYISDVTRCTMSWKDTVNVTVNSLPVVKLGPDKTMCSNEPAITFDAGNAGSTYLWSSAETSQTIAKSSSGTYIVKVTNNKQCSAKDTVVLTVNPAPLPSIVNQSICFGDPAATFNAGAGYTSYSWTANGTGSAQTTSGSTAGNYTVTVTDAKGCSGSATATLKVDTLPVPVIANHSICAGAAAATFDAGAGYSSYKWTANGTGTSQTTSGNVAGNYTVTVTTSKGCKGSASGVLTVNAAPTINLGADTTICFNGKETYNLTIPNTYTSIAWSTGDVSNTVAVSKAEKISVTVSNGSCAATDTINISDCAEIKLCFPNVFTPNSDGFNDDFRPCGIDKEQIDNGNKGYYNDHISFMHFVVYDRWGIKMYENSNPEIPIWDGYFKSNPASAGTYFWTVKYTDFTSASFEQSGYVTLLKD